MGNQSKAKKANGKASSGGLTPSHSATEESVVAEPARVKEILKTSLKEALSRQGGDGESLPDTPPNERMPVKSSNVEMEKSKSCGTPFQINIKVDVMAVFLFAVALFTRLYRLDQPPNVV